MLLELIYVYKLLSEEEEKQKNKHLMCVNKTHALIFGFNYFLYYLLM